MEREYYPGYQPYSSVNYIFLLPFGNYPKMLPETKIKLEEYFKSYNEELNELTGINFNR